jgi:proteic killer suppression protein
MLKSIKHRGLKQLYRTGSTQRISTELHGKILERMDVLEVAESLKDLNIPGYNFHKLSNRKPPCWTIHVNGPWCITFNWKDGEAIDVNFENYH